MPQTRCAHGDRQSLTELNDMLGRPVDMVLVDTGVLHGIDTADDAPLQRMMLTDMVSRALTELVELDRLPDGTMSGEQVSIGSFVVRLAIVPPRGADAFGIALLIDPA